MIFHRLKSINKNQKGFTLIELIVAIAITGLIIGAIVASIFQLFNISARSDSRMLAVRQVQNAGHWISRDTLMAQSVDPDPADDGDTLGTEILILSWVAWERVGQQQEQYIDSYKVCYTYDADNEKLWRYQTITTKEYDKDGDIADPQPDDQNLTTFIADYITSISIPAMVDDKLNVTITASVPDASGAIEQRTYEIMPRSSA